MGHATLHNFFIDEKTGFHTGDSNRLNSKLSIRSHSKMCELYKEPFLIKNILK